jgi:DNA polymerase-1
VPPASKTMPAARRPLLVVDGDNFAHRSYHALPKSIRRAGNRGAGAIVGFANFLLRRERATRAVLVEWDTLGAPTYRQTLFPGYHGGREFDDELVGAIGRAPGICRCLWLRRRQSARL